MFPIFIASFIFISASPWGHEAVHIVEEEKYRLLLLVHCTKVAQLLFINGLSCSRAATLARELELLVVDLMVAPVSEASTRLQRSLVLSFGP